MREEKEPGKQYKLMKYIYKEFNDKLYKKTLEKNENTKRQSIINQNINVLNKNNVNINGNTKDLDENSDIFNKIKKILVYNVTNNTKTLIAYNEIKGYISKEYFNTPNENIYVQKYISSKSKKPTTIRLVY